MAMKTIQVHVDDSSRSDERLAVAAQLAARNDAHLVGLYVVAPVVVPSYVAAELPDEILVRRDEELKKMTAAAKARFETVASKAGVNGEWHQSELLAGSVAATLGELARYGDLNIIGQGDGEEGGWGNDLVEAFILSSGRPALVVPYAGHFEPVGSRIMLAWTPTREATRATFDALPLMQQAERVVVLSITPGSASEEGPLPGVDIATTLARHNVHADVQRLTGSDLSVGDTLLSRLADESIDMLVMGAYGHSRMREFVFGGATRNILQHMTVPVLMSH